MEHLNTVDYEHFNNILNTENQNLTFYNKTKAEADGNNEKDKPSMESPRKKEKANRNLSIELRKPTDYRSRLEDQSEHIVKELDRLLEEDSMEGKLKIKNEILTRLGNIKLEQDLQEIHKSLENERLMTLEHTM